MPRLKITAWPDRLAFVNSLFARIDASPMVGYLPPPHSRDGIQPPTDRGEAFLVRTDEDTDREYRLIIMQVRKKGRGGDVVEFDAVLWAACDEFRDLIFGDPANVWIEFKGELDFNTQEGWLERISH